MRVSAALVSVIAAVTVIACVRVKEPSLRPTPAMAGATLWKDPGNLRGKDLLNGPWGRGRAPVADALYTFVEQKHTGTNPGMTVRDPEGREWSVKQIAPGALDVEAKVEVTLSRLLSAIGYYQPADYFLPQFRLKDGWGSHTEVGGRFRLKDEALKEIGDWSWTHNPFIGSRPYNGLLVLMMIFNSTDLKDSNNSIYESRANGRTERWYVVRDIGSALGDTNLIAPRKNNYPAFEQHPFILGEQNGYLQFASHRLYAGLVRDRITREDVVWASDLLSRLSERQWQDAFRAGGYQPQVANQFIRKFREKIRQGQDLSRRASAQ